MPRAGRPTGHTPATGLLPSGQPSTHVAPSAYVFAGHAATQSYEKNCLHVSVARARHLTVGTGVTPAHSPPTGRVRTPTATSGAGHVATHVPFASLAVSRRHQPHLEKPSAHA